ncbi:T-lymphoma invasion and metastasis-inducing protein 2 isoform X2 [Denticeps clupeoides]|uniref:T-lymphoma invasion and metastasis-inducing protein 2 isoform X2 n=1 Tax=Denticeps clupeoides TaxID=299321 RepID=UPI0010A52DA5|nr:T-lymphoma invasion and metastasis-inducing protein 2-like isoform X2 [Denticeps clupeoides]
MGNTDSQYSSFILPGKSKPCSLKLPSSKDQAISAHSWWRGTEVGGGYKAGLSSQNSPPYLSQHYDYMSKNDIDSKQTASSPLLCERGKRNGEYSGNGLQTLERTSSPPLGSRGSPKVLFSQDGTLRVEFTNTRREQEAEEEVFRPNAPNNRTSKGSSLSSDGSWYDSPWGNSAELSDNVFHPNPTVNQPATFSSFACNEDAIYPANGYHNDTYASENSSNGFSHSFMYGTGNGGGNGSQYSSSGYHSNGYNTCSSGRTEDSGIGDSLVALQEGLYHYSNPNLVSSFPFPTTAALQEPPPRHDHHASLASALDSAVGQSEELASETVGTPYSSLTLPCRKSAPVAGSNTRKDSLKSRIRRLSDWTGSLSRKKRRLQEPYMNESSDMFGANSVTTDSQSSIPHWGLSLPSAQQAHTHSTFGSSTCLPSQACHSDVLRQNIYQNFMQELETAGSGSGGTVEGVQTSEGDGEQGNGDLGESSSGSLGSLEQLDQLFEKEQGVVRRAGWLSFKPLITLHKERKLEMVARRKWKQYWVTLKGCMLLFYETYGKSSIEPDMSPCLALLAEDSIVQAVPEHPKKENVFCLSNAFGDVYLFQAGNQTDLENWVTAIHSAGASLLAKRQGKEDTVRLLRSQSRGLLQKIDMDGKMKKMAELQLSVISDQKNRKAIESQIQQWEQNLEKFNVDLFRMRCYLASLQGSELPNPKSLLAVASRPSKMALSRLGIFSVSSFHALICTRDETTLRRRCRSLPRRVRNKRGLFSSMKGLDSLSKRNVREPKARNMQPNLFGLRVRRRAGEEVEVVTAAATDAIRDLVYDELEMFPLSVFTLNLSRSDTSTDFGFAFTGHVDGLRQSHVYVSEVNPEGLAFNEGLKTGDEILVLNGTSVASLDLGLIQTFFSHQTLSLVLRREDAVLDDCDLSDPFHLVPPPREDLFAEQCPTWLRDGARPQESMEGTVVAGSEEGTQQNIPAEHPRHHGKSSENMCPLYQTFPESSVATLVPEDQRNPYSTDCTLQRPYPRHMSITERLRKVIQELVDTEKSYVKDLGSLFEIYLKPLQSETFLSQDEMESLFGSLPEMLDFQRVFLHTLEEHIASSPDFSTLETPEQFKKLLFSLGGLFLYYADHFKLYSGFCANHIKVQKVLERAKTDQAFKEFLEARNPTKQHSSTLESYLIKPVQRVLKYPLLLRELVSLTNAESEEHSHLTEALKAMEKVASHINEMQKIYEDYGTVFDQLVAEQSSSEKEVTEISMGEFLLHSSVQWLNPLPSLGRMRKDPELTLFIFKRAAILVYRENTKMKKKMTSSRSAYSQGDLDPFKFRWLIPVSALQVRLGNSAGSENASVWELVHTRSEVKGRPEMVFQLSSSGLESKTNAVKALRSLLKENGKRTRPDEKVGRNISTFQRSQPAASVRMGSWVHRQQPHLNGLRSSLLDADGDSHSEPALPSRTRHFSGDRSATLGKRATLCSLTSALEAQLQRLHFSEEVDCGTAQEFDQRLTSGVQEGQGLQESPSSMDLNALLARDFSVQSLASVVNEDCFYDTVLGIQKAAISTL